MAGGAQAGVDHRRDRAFAVGAGDVYGAERALGMAETRQDRADVVEAELDAELFEAEEVIEMRHVRGAASAAIAAATGSGRAASAAPMKRSARAMVAFISRRSITRSIMPFSSRN